MDNLQEFIQEAVGAFNLLDTLDMRLILRKGLKVEEVVTDIRVVKGVATVTQDAAVKVLVGGKRILDLLVTFDPKEMNKIEYVDALARKIKKLPVVETVLLRSLNGTTIHTDGGKRLVY